MSSAPTPAVAAAIEELSALLGERLSTNRGVREQHGRGEAHHAPQPPDAVAFARSTEEVSRIVTACARHRVPVIAFGAGTSLEGHVAAVQGGVSVDLTQMNRILEVHPDDLDALVEAGVTRKQLEAHLRDSGLFFPIDPGADATIGGMAATRASGTNAVRYGTMRETVLGLTVVLADGRIVHTGGRAKKSSAGYDLTRLFVGSEGTLGIITEIRLRLTGIPEAVSAAVCPFPDVDSAVQAVIATIQSGIPVARIELLDELQMQACIAFSKLEGMEAVPTLFYEFHGTESGVAEQAEQAGAIAAEFGARGFEWARRTEDRNRLWQARHDAYYAALALRPGCVGWATDVCVPISQLARSIAETRADVAEAGLQAPIVGHVGDGNFHLLMLLDPNDPTERERARAVNKRMVARAIALGGTCTGEHGIGLGKIDSLRQEHPEGIEIMRLIKQALDPEDLMNPGKILRR
ncbi:FAD-linked oxidase C-terminal domain-containing protein [Geminicoccaceae bacterium 1502E]|nr:FAD-linked oxidase C-terminal domain-containing protein [Geminicoccaceae bacterium 1502E]